MYWFGLVCVCQNVYMYVIMGYMWMYVYESMCKNSIKQTVSTYLTLLQESELLEVDKTLPRTYLLCAACSKEEYEHLCVKQLVQKSFNGSISKFVAAFTGGKKLTKEEADELRKLI